MLRILTIITLAAFMFALVPPVIAEEQRIRTTGVSLNHGNLEMVINTREQLIATVRPANATNKNVYWVSGDDQIVKVRKTANFSAEITAVAAGETTVSVFTEDRNLQAVCRVKVVIPLLRMYMDRAEKNLEPGESYQFEVFFHPADATNQLVRWQTSDSLVIDVDETGLGTARHPGTARIVARSDEDDNIYAYCTVTVAEAPAPEDEDVNEKPFESNAETSEEENALEELTTDRESDTATDDDQNMIESNFTLVTTGIIIIIALAVLAVIVIRRRN